MLWAGSSGPIRGGMRVGVEQPTNRFESVTFQESYNQEVLTLEPNLANMWLNLANLLLNLLQLS